MNDATKSPRRKRKAAGEAGVAPAPHPATSPPPELRSMGVVIRAVMRGQARALIFERLAHEVARLFRGVDGEPPRLLLKLPGGGAFPCELEDVMEIERGFARMASDERLKIAKLMSSAVLADPAEVDRRDEVSRGPNVPTPEGEVLVPNPAVRSAAPGATTGTGRTRA
jgi:hypothetical protein